MKKTGKGRNVTVTGEKEEEGKKKSK